MTPEEPQRHMTIKDLVRLSGYSLGTVSRVLNNQPNVSERARQQGVPAAHRRGNVPARLDRICQTLRR